MGADASLSALTGRRPEAARGLLSPVDDLAHERGLRRGVDAAAHAVGHQSPLERGVPQPVVVMGTQPFGEQTEMCLRALVLGEEMRDRQADILVGEDRSGVVADVDHVRPTGRARDYDGGRRHVARS